MKIRIDKGHIESVVSSLQSFLSKKDVEITSHILIETKEKNLILKATDNEIGIMVKIENEMENSEEQATINGREFLQSIKNLNGNDITISIQNNKVEFNDGIGKITRSSFIASGFPKFPEEYRKLKINIDSKTLIESLKRLFPVIEINNTRAEYRNALIDIKEGKFNFIATDTKRLEVISFENQSIEKIKFMFPKKAINEVQKFFFNEQASIYFHENTIIIENDKYTFWTRIPNGDFIDYEKIIPESKIKYNIKINKEEMIRAIKLINSVSSKVKLTFNKELITFDSLGEQDSSATTKIKIDEKLNEKFINSIDEYIVICVDSKHVFDFITHIDTTDFDFGINENKNSACMLKSNNFLLVVMPILI